MHGKEDGGGVQLGDSDVLGGRLVLVELSEDREGKSFLLYGVFITVLVAPVLLL